MAIYLTELDDTFNFPSPYKALSDPNYTCLNFVLQMDNLYHLILIDMVQLILL